MAADWDEPELTSLYTDFLDDLKERDVDTATLFIVAPTNPVESMIRYVRASNKFQEYLSAVWTDKILSLAGGGTGAATAAGARTNLGLGTISTQDSNNVSITGGSITGIATLTAAGKITSGSGVVDITNAAGKLAAFTSTFYQDLSGANFTGLNASALASGTVPTARLGSGSATSATFLRGDSTWAAVPGFSVQEISVTVTSGNTSNTGAISAVVLANSYIVPAGQRGTSAASIGGTWQFNSTTQIQFTMASALGADVTARCFVVSSV